ncbi:MAG: hypothetical protein A3F33_02295 [Candidatus Woykebacteria bacterium RIFCSPHIGHO2_12_FULL_43_10]|uniref:Helix-hairpin-helix DNA-binding motif class 1 domain-containing protein n=2 Tax=Candidatus Woykeibacteriota TaxID=1817899 RepID=A0A1G1WY18_9BACT|nr:MAG: hypothetical protein A2802_02710 [Candidatus Woykebacteria bacterium RIFCSPHIGHO2_01_FULL_43_29]OGY29827.1 MAG: hypothetical protein A3J50_04425 [Candidatus Woykebacteria bacterium RIFCSPHIGHO2_02_FULL_43_16b]OGY30495.1 MAG: hypothetical protein A3F33_02295 [Candidatus Woykebacteria bacterium RIFCSPHIGHO2_12_FULL_43_10]OGY32656.1 MAG: hypothetical protein A3A61_04165 [Candidatus Woykebacteria bacterium RIFCSPLOWO2_01_FULL_43_14]
MRNLLQKYKVAIFFVLLGLIFISLGLFSNLRPTSSEEIKHSEFSIDNQSFDDIGLINLNTASEAQLISLPGIGEVTAGKIISARPYQSIDELTVRKIVTKKVYDKIQSLVIAP